jgi:hypothetical protein
VVIAVIALLMAIIMPALRKAKEYARKVICGSNLRQIGIAIGSYESQYSFNFRTHSGEKGWYYENGTADMPYESYPNSPVNDRAQALYQYYLMENDILPDYKVFFCPGVSRISYEKNYLYNDAYNGNLIEHTVANMRYMMETPGFSDRPCFWSTYAWLWKKGPDNPNWPGPPNNNATDNVLLADVPSRAYLYAMINLNNNDTQMLNNIFGSGVDAKTVQTVPHGNVLLSDLSMRNPADKPGEYCMWLWNSEWWAGNAVTIP